MKLNERLKRTEANEDAASPSARRTRGQQGTDPLVHLKRRAQEALFAKLGARLYDPSLSEQELQGISQKSCGVLRDMGPQIQWVQSYVTDDKIYCVYIAPNEEAVREHASQGGFPANRVSEISSVIDPTTAE